MSLEEDAYGILTIKGSVVEYARKLFDLGDYFGAYTLIHSLIECLMEELYERSNIETLGNIKAYDKIPKDYNYRYTTLAKMLLKTKGIAETEYSNIIKFADVRNRLVHRIVKYSIRPYPMNVIRRNGVKKKDIVTWFERGIDLAKSLYEKCNRRVSGTVRLDIPKGSKKSEPVGIRVPTANVTEPQDKMESAAQNRRPKHLTEPTRSRSKSARIPC